MVLPNSAYSTWTSHSHSIPLSPHTPSPKLGMSCSTLALIVSAFVNSGNSWSPWGGGTGLWQVLRGVLIAMFVALTSTFTTLSKPCCIPTSSSMLVGDTWASTSLPKPYCRASSSSNSASLLGKTLAIGGVLGVEGQDSDKGLGRGGGGPILSTFTIVPSSSEILCPWSPFPTLHHLAKI